ncbi:MAG: 16S rRNA (guanine(527)-N(7))-methyltransferase RsmG [Desulfobacterales bacterium]|nr:16S rRNA (guanine(527)-N(7))-methyltransferase RsmG [Desulfobacterales bacterium]
MEVDQTNVENEKPVKLPIKDVLDLHTFLPKKIPSLLEEYLNACRQAKIYSVRIIHGKGRGMLKNLVGVVLEKLPMVASFSDAAPSGGGWGATIVELKREIDFESPEWAEILYEGARAMGVRVEAEQITRFCLHARELMAWNRFADLTAVTDPEEVAEKHFVDVMPVAPLLRAGSRVLDIGSGGGFPGIPLKVMRPDLCLCLIDASRKKVNFLKHVIRTLGLKNIEARHIRAEELCREDQGKGAVHNVIISRAASRLDGFLAQALRLLRSPGIIIAMKGASIQADLESVGSVIATEGISVNTKAYLLPRLGIERTLIIFSKK